MRQSRNRGMFIIAFSLYLFVSAFPFDLITKRVIRFLYAYALACFYSCHLISRKQVLFILILDWIHFVYNYVLMRNWIRDVWLAMDETFFRTRFLFDWRFETFLIVDDLIDTLIAFFAALKVNKKLKLPERVGYI